MRVRASVTTVRLSGNHYNPLLTVWGNPKLHLRRGREQHREPVTRVARRAPLLAQHDRRPRLPGVQLGRELGGQLARHPAQLRRPRPPGEPRWRSGRAGCQGRGAARAACPAPRRRSRAHRRGGPRRRPRPPRAGPGRPAQARRGRDSDPRLDRRAGTPRPIPRRHRPGTSSAPRSRRRSTRLKLPVVRVGGVYPSRRKQKVSPTTMQHTAEVPAPSPPEQPQPSPPDAPQPDPKGPETPDNPSPPEPAMPPGETV